MVDIWQIIEPKYSCPWNQKDISGQICRQSIYPTVQLLQTKNFSNGDEDYHFNRMEANTKSPLKKITWNPRLGIHHSIIWRPMVTSKLHHDLQREFHRRNKFSFNSDPWFIKTVSNRIDRASNREPGGSPRMYMAIAFIFKSSTIEYWGVAINKEHELRFNQAESARQEIFRPKTSALRQFGPKTNSDRKPDSDQRQIRTQFWNSAQIISLINLITYLVNKLNSIYFLKAYQFCNQF